MAPRTDAEAIAASLSEPNAFADVFDRHFDAIHRYLRRRVGSQIADELASETFAQAFEHRKRFDLDRPDARPWLYGIAHNLLRHHYRAEERALRAYARSFAADGAVPPATPGDVAELLAELSPGERDVLLLVAWAELEYAEVAEALGIPVGTVRSRLNRARGRIRELLEPSGQYEKETI
jgi:DNA-directed RNA polymerase specialized sigma24 family protein